MTTTPTSGLLFNAPTKFRSTAQLVAWYEMEIEPASPGGEGDQGVFARMGLVGGDDQDRLPARQVVAEQHSEGTRHGVGPVCLGLERHHIQEGVDGIEGVGDDRLGSDVEDSLVVAFVQSRSSEGEVGEVGGRRRDQIDLAELPEEGLGAKHGVEVGGGDLAALLLAAFPDFDPYPVHDHGGKFRPLGDHDVLPVI